MLTSVPVIEAWWDGQHVDVIHGPSREELLLVPGSMLSVIALHGRCTSVTLGSVKWPLVGADLAPAVGLGLSNVVVPPTDEDGQAQPPGDAVAVPVELSSGVLTIFDEPVHASHRTKDLP